MAFRRRRTFRGRSRRDRTNHWLGFEATASLTAAATVGTIAAIDPTDYEVAATLQPSAQLVVIIGSIVIFGDQLTADYGAMGYWGFVKGDGDSSIALADWDMSPASLTDERWLQIGAWAVSGGNPTFHQDFRFQPRTPLKDNRIFLSMTQEFLAATGTANVRVVYRALLKDI